MRDQQPFDELREVFIYRLDQVDTRLGRIEERQDEFGEQLAELRTLAGTPTGSKLKTVGIGAGSGGIVIGIIEALKALTSAF